MSRARNWCFTFNNYTHEDCARIEALDLHYLVYGKEVGESGTPHLQGYFVLSNAKTLSAVKKMFLPGKPHLEVARGDAKSNYDYCSKDGDVFEKGVRPMSQKEKGDSEKERWVEILSLAKEGRIDEIDPEVQIKHFRSLENIRNKHVMNKEMVALDSLDHEWHWGPSGYGKSSSIRRQNREFYYKMKNKWWDGYRHEAVVLIDDVDPTHASKFGAFLKEWADHYPFRAEVKSASIMIRPKKIIVTSQYSIEQVFGHDQEFVSALKRRFKEVHYTAIVPYEVGGYETDEAQLNVDIGVDSDDEPIVRRYQEPGGWCEE
jgi:RNA helicase./Putative viral replication protein.